MQNLIEQTRNLFNIRLQGAQVQALQTYLDELLEWNSRFNLTAIRNPPEIITKHFLDSFSCSLAWGEAVPASLVDVGTGAGFPGLPLKIAYPDMRLTLLEAVGKKANFCRHMVETLRLDRVEVIHARAEELGQHPQHRERYDWAVARAVANLPVLAEYLLPLVRVGGAALAQKGDSGPAEAWSAANAIKLLGGVLRQVHPVLLPGIAEQRSLVVLDKRYPTPTKYPRRPGEPAKKPL